MYRPYRPHPRPVVAQLVNGKMVTLLEPARPELNNFVIVCQYGDWSGFRTLAECEAQYAELEGYAKTDHRPDGYYWVEER